MEKRTLTAEMKRRILMTVVGVLVTGFSVGMFEFSNFGVDPFQVIAHGIWLNTEWGFGNLYTVINIIMLIMVLIFDRKKIGLGTLINIFLLGYVAEFSGNLWKTLIPTPSFWVRTAFLLTAVIITCLGASLYFTGDLGVSTYDAVALYISQHQNKVPFAYCRIATDLFCVVVGFLLGADFLSGYTGIGTIITAFFMGPLISFFNKRISIPFRTRQ